MLGVGGVDGKGRIEGLLDAGWGEGEGVAHSGIIFSKRAKKKGVAKA